MVKISSSEAARAGLPPVSIAVDPGKSGMAAKTFPEQGRYLQLSGPPGGPLGLKIDECAGTSGTAASLGALAKKRFAGDPLELGAFEEITLAGARRAALSCTTGASQARAAHLLVLFPAAPGADRGVLLDAWIGARAPGVPAPSAVVKLAPLADVLGTLAIHFE